MSASMAVLQLSMTAHRHATPGTRRCAPTRSRGRAATSIE